MAVEFFSWPNLRERMFGGREDRSRDCPHTRRTRIRSSYRGRLLWLIPKIGFWLTSLKIIWKISFLKLLFCFVFLIELDMTDTEPYFCRLLSVVILPSYMQSRCSSLVGSMSAWYVDGRGFYPHTRQYSFVDFSHEITSMVILSRSAVVSYWLKNIIGTKYW